MVLKSYAKINLSLSVIRKLKNGLHDIQSLFSLVNLYDEISIKKLKNGRKDVISFFGPYSKHVKKYDNSVVRIMKFIRNNNLTSNYYSIKVFKKIPVFAGLGGGTSNAASVYKFFVEKKIKKKIFKKLVNIIGSDIRLFFQDYGYLKNLNTVIKISKFKKLYFLIVFPGIKCSTSEIYSKVKIYSPKKKFSRKNIENQKEINNFIFKEKNDLQSIVEKKYPVTQKILINLRREQGCYLSRMSGSGSACYGLFLNEKCSKVALKRLKKKYPKFWFSLAKTI